MILSFPVRTPPTPVGGTVAIFEWANGLTRLGHEVHLRHFPNQRGGFASIEELTWFQFEPLIQHHFPPPFDLSGLPPADVLFHYSAELDPAWGQPMMLVQGARDGPEALRETIQAPCPKACTSTWLADLARSAGVPDEQLEVIRGGIDHDTFAHRRPLDDRPIDVVFHFARSRVKQSATAFRALSLLRTRRKREVRAVAFGSQAPERVLPPNVEFVQSPPRTVLVDDVYNRAKVVVITSQSEGLGLVALEGMACGCALVTTDNGGSREYAEHDETALVYEPGDVDTLVEHIDALLEDDERRRRLATNGRDRARTFRWDTSTAQLASFCERYLADPAKLQTGVVLPTHRRLRAPRTEDFRTYAHQVQVTSFGGSGTTALLFDLEDAGILVPKTPGHFPFKHIRRPPPAGEAPPGFRAILLLGDPRNAVASIFRRGIQVGHYRWLRMMEEPAPGALERLTSIDTFLAAGVDEYQLDDFVDGWTRPGAADFPVLVVRYEAIAEAWPMFCEFVGLPADHPCPLVSGRASDWQTAPAAVRDGLDAMYGDLARRIEARPPAELLMPA